MDNTKVMIVDDEILVRIGLRSTISWEEFGFTVVADAANGAQALEKFGAADPDILITDIRMPGIDGIELIKKLKEKKPQLRTVILTNYDNFEYAKQALELGADEYLLKTDLDNQSLLPKLQKLQAVIIREKEQNLQYQELQQKALRGIAYQKKHLAEGLLSGKLTAEECQSLIQELNLKWEDRLYQLVMVKGKISKKTPAAANGMSGSLSSAASLQLIEELAEKINGALVWEAPEPLKWGIIYNYSPTEETEYYKQAIPFNIRQVKSCLKQYLQISTVAVFGKPTGDIGQLPEVWRKLQQMSEYRFFWPEKELIFGEDIPALLPETARIRISEQNLHQFIRRGETAKVEAVLAEIFDKILHSLDPELLHQVWRELLSEIFLLSREYDLRVIDFLSPEEQDQHCLENFNSIPEIENWFQEKFHLLMARISQRNARTYSFPIRQAIAYLEENYAHNITLEALSGHVGLSKNHLCTLFRSETGENFVDYLHRIRIGRAQELLRNTDLRVSEVGLRVGYQDAKYFTKVFQKYLNCTPSEYRDSYEV
ncbi:MAG: response regulator [Firmicutes bacterium]|nr:response regulator [Bacillota bacterium]